MILLVSHLNHIAIVIILIQLENSTGQAVVHIVIRKLKDTDTIGSRSSLVVGSEVSRLFIHTGIPQHRSRVVHCRRSAPGAQRPCLIGNGHLRFIRDPECSLILMVRPFYNLPDSIFILRITFDLYSFKINCKVLVFILHTITLAIVHFQLHRIDADRIFCQLALRIVNTAFLNRIEIITDRHRTFRVIHIVYANIPDRFVLIGSLGVDALCIICLIHQPLRLRFNRTMIYGSIIRHLIKQTICVNSQ